MVRFFRCFALVITLFYGFNLFAETCPVETGEKIYILPEQLGFCSEGIFVVLDNTWYKTEALFSDRNGMYVRNLWPQENGCRKGYWPCRNCDRCVHEDYDICPHCHRPV